MFEKILKNISNGSEERQKSEESKKNFFGNFK